MNDGTKRPKAQDQDHTNPFEEWERSNLRGKQRKRAAPKVDADGPKLPLLSLNEPAPGADPDPAVVGKIKESVSRDPKGLQRALEGLGLSLRYNLRGATAEWRGHDLPGKHDGAWNAVNDRFDSFVREQIATSFVTGPKNLPAKFGRETWADSVNALCFMAEVDPFVSWLDKLPECGTVPSGSAAGSSACSPWSERRS